MNHGTKSIMPMVLGIIGGINGIIYGIVYGLAGAIIDVATGGEGALIYAMGVGILLLSIGGLVCGCLARIRFKGSLMLFIAGALIAVLVIVFGAVTGLGAGGWIWGLITAVLFIIGGVLGMLALPKKEDANANY